MKNKCFKKGSLQRKLIVSILIIIAISSSCAGIIATNILPHSLAGFALIEDEIRMDLIRLFRTYSFFSLLFIFGLSAGFITLIINKTLKPVRALTEGTNKVAQGDFDVLLPMDLSKNDELSNLTDSFNKMAKELSFINTLNSDFINNVSHEFKTPISSIQGFATVLLGTDLTDEQKEYAEIIAHESARLTKLTSNVLKLTKLENQVIITDKENFYIDEQIRHSYVLLQSELSLKGIEIDFDLQQVKYYGNPELISQIWNNLLSNAIKFTDEHGQIFIRCYEDGDNAVVSIKDSGIGMSSDTVAHVFDKFFQGDKSHFGQGNGLGLSLVKRVVELCGGRVEIKSELGGGSEFVVCLPR